MEKFVAIVSILYFCYFLFILLYELYSHRVDNRYELAKLKRGDHFIRWDISLKAKRRYIKGGTDDE